MQVTGSGAPQGDPKPVETKLLSRAAEVARLAGGLAQTAYYAFKIWLAHL
ncbi:MULTISPECIES: hypothetical protein [Streptomyces]|nr:hypothetical protein [[Kitasatospora] papulosa]